MQEISLIILIFCRIVIKLQEIKCNKKPLLW